jgi:hypothetical protein
VSLLDARSPRSAISASNSQFLHIAQPKEVLAHAPDPPKNESGAYGIRIALSQQQK